MPTVSAAGLRAVGGGSEPGAAHSLSCRLAGNLVLAVAVERPSAEGHLLCAVRAPNSAECIGVQISEADRVLRQYRGPGGGALARAIGPRRVGGVLVES